MVTNLEISFVLPAKNIGGGTRVVTQYANKLVGQGHDVTLVYTQIPPYLGDLIRTKGVRNLAGKLFEMREFDQDVSWPIDADVRSVPTLSQGIQHIWHDRIPDADVVIAASWRVVPATCRLPVSKGVKCHLVQYYEVWDLWNSDHCWRQAERRATESRDICLEMYETTPKSRHVRRQKRLVDDALQRQIKKLTVSPWLRQLLEQRVGRSVATTLPNGINTNQFYPDKESSDLLATGESVSVLAPYRTPKYKGLTTLLDAFERVRDRMEAHLYFYGSSPDRPLPDWCTHVGMVPDDELRRLYSTADVFVSSSHAEGWGLPSMEAAACGTAVVSTENGWVRDYPDDDTVLKIPPRDVSALSRGITELVEDPDRRETLARRAFELVTDRFTIEKSATKLEKTLQRISR